MQAFAAKTCGCALGDNGDPCTSTIKIVDILDCRNNLPELSSTELDLVILGMIHCAINCDQVRDSGRAEKTRQRTRMPFYFQSHRICLKLFFSRIVSTRPDSTVSLNIIGLVEYRFVLTETSLDVYLAPLSVLKLLNEW